MRKQNDHVGERVAAKLKGFVLEGWVYWEAQEEGFFLTFKKPTRVEMVRCPKCKHSHGTSFESEDGVPLSKAQVKLMGLVEGDTCAKVCVTPLDTQEE